VREYFREGAKFCQLDMNSLLTGTGRLSRVLQKDNIQEQNTSNDNPPSTQQDLARSTSLDATNDHQTSPPAHFSEPWGGEMLVASTPAPSTGLPNKRARADGDISAQANDRDGEQSETVSSPQVSAVFPGRDLLGASAGFSGRRSCDAEVDRPHTHESVQVLQLATRGELHPCSTMTSRQSGYQQNPPSQWWSCAGSRTQAPAATNSPLPGTELIRRQGTTAPGTQVTEHRCFNRLDTTSTPSNNQLRVAASGTVGHHTPHELPSVHEGVEQPEVMVQPLAPFSVPPSMVSSQLEGYTQELRPGWLLDKGLSEQQGPATQIPFHNLSSHANSAMDTTQHSGHIHNHHRPTQPHETVDADNSTWYNTVLHPNYQVVEMNQDSWNFDFPMPSFWSQ
jgi:hypothetical protein